MSPNSTRWFVDRMALTRKYRKVPMAKLSKGTHTIAFELTSRKPWISKLWVTNDPSFASPHFSAQLRFGRLRRQPAEVLTSARCGHNLNMSFAEGGDPRSERCVYVANCQREVRLFQFGRT